MSLHLWCLLAGALTAGPFEPPTAVPAPAFTTSAALSASGEPPWSPGPVNQFGESFTSGRPPGPALNHGERADFSDLPPEEADPPSRPSFAPPLAQSPEPFAGDGIFILPADPALEQPLNTRRVR